MIPEPMEIKTSEGIIVLTADNCTVCVFPEAMKKYEHVFVIDHVDGKRFYIFDPTLVKKARTRGFPLYWRPYPTKADREAFNNRSLTERELSEFVAQLQFGIDWEELE